MQANSWKANGIFQDVHALMNLCYIEFALYKYILLLLLLLLLLLNQGQALGHTFCLLLLLLLLIAFCCFPGSRYMSSGMYSALATF